MQHLTLLELNKLISKAIEERLNASYWVIAEISEIRLNQKGHCYLEVVEKEGDDIKAKTRATIWAYTYRNLSTWFTSKTGESLRPGLKILFNAVVQYHEVFGLSLNIRDIDANFTLGERARRKAEIVEKLKEDGVFDMNRELSLPLVPQRIAVISSPTAAGFGDFINHIQGNAFGYKFGISLFSAIMQGSQAANSIIAAMHSVNNKLDQFDLLVIIRGGGASADLDCYDNYELASHVAQFPIPVITGIGHERDETILDLVAHTQMKTPTAVAEFLISGMRIYEEQFLLAFENIAGQAKEKMTGHKHRLERTARKLCAVVKNICGEKERDMHAIFQRLKYHVRKDWENGEKKLTDLSARVKTLPLKVVKNEKLKLEAKERFLEAIDPGNVLKRGYSITKVNGISLNKYTDKIKKGDLITTKTAEVEIESTVQTLKKSDHGSGKF